MSDLVNASASGVLTDPPVTRPVFGIVFTLNGVDVPISTADLADIKTKGFSFTLPQPVPLGSPNDFLAWIDTTFNTTLKQTLEDAQANLPEAIAEMVASLMNVSITIEEAGVQVPAKPDGGEQGPTLYNIVISATFPGDGFPLIPGSDLLKIKGGVAGATNMPVAA